MTELLTWVGVGASTGAAFAYFGKEAAPYLLLLFLMWGGSTSTVTAEEDDSRWCLFKGLMAFGAFCFVVSLGVVPLAILGGLIGLWLHLDDPKTAEK